MYMDYSKNEYSQPKYILVSDFIELLLIYFHIICLFFFCN